MAGAEGAWMLSVYLRETATRCRDWSRDCFDLRTAERLRLLADELIAKARELDWEPPPPIVRAPMQQVMQQQQAKLEPKED